LPEREPRRMFNRWQNSPLIRRKRKTNCTVAKVPSGGRSSRRRKDNSSKSAGEDGCAAMLTLASTYHYVSLTYKCFTLRMQKVPLELPFGANSFGASLRPCRFHSTAKKVIHDLTPLCSTLFCPSSACGQPKRPRSKRFAQTHSPLPSQNTASCRSCETRSLTAGSPPVYVAFVLLSVLDSCLHFSIQAIPRPVCVCFDAYDSPETIPVPKLQHILRTVQNEFVCRNIDECTFWNWQETVQN
jgi:hypothetical protein